MAGRQWKATERSIARKLGGERVPVTGRQRGSAPDIAHPLYSLEVKHRASIPGWIKNAMAQAVASIRGDQTPVVVVHEAGTRFDGDLVIVRMKDFLALTKTTLPTLEGGPDIVPVDASEEEES